MASTINVDALRHNRRADKEDDLIEVVAHSERDREVLNKINLSARIGSSGAGRAGSGRESGIEWDGESGIEWGRESRDRVGREEVGSRCSLPI